MGDTDEGIVQPASKGVDDCPAASTIPTPPWDTSPKEVYLFLP